jgi:hypothetical protein
MPNIFMFVIIIINNNYYGKWNSEILQRLEGFRIYQR